MEMESLFNDCPGIPKTGVSKPIMYLLSEKKIHTGWAIARVNKFPYMRSEVC